MFFKSTVKRYRLELGIFGWDLFREKLFEKDIGLFIHVSAIIL